MQAIEFDQINKMYRMLADGDEYAIEKYEKMTVGELYSTLQAECLRSKEMKRQMKKSSKNSNDD